VTFTAIDVRTPRGTQMSFELNDVSDGYVLKDVGGLDPVGATIVSSSFAGIDGTQYHSASREDRQIQLKVAFKVDYTITNVSRLRQRLYSFFMPKRPVSMTLYDTETGPVDISGYVKGCEAVIFDKNPAIDITIICPQPDFVVQDETVIEGGTVNDATETLLEYPGNIEVGMKFILELDRDLTQFTIYQRVPDGSTRTLDFAGDLEDGDILTIGTVVGSKGASLKRGSTETSVLYGIDPTSNWIQLDEGDNYIRVYAEGAEIPYTISYTTRYGGL
jgi:hypothetical protein